MNVIFFILFAFIVPEFHSLHMILFWLFVCQTLITFSPNANYYFLAFIFFSILKKTKTSLIIFYTAPLCVEIFYDSKKQNQQKFHFHFFLGSDIGAPASFYNAIANEEDYLNALQQSANNAAMMAAAAGQINSSNGTMQLQINGDLSAPYTTMSEMQAYLVGNDMSMLPVRPTRFH